MSTIVKSTSTGFKAPPLLYPASALAPVISQTTVEHHYGKHFTAYINKLNELIAGNEYEEMTLREIVEQAPRGPLANNAGQVLNHSLYFEQFTPNPPTNNRPSGILQNSIRFDFGNFDTLKRKMEDAAASHFGSGWVWLAQEESGKLTIQPCHDGDNPIRHGMTPLYGIDVWEHAYYLDYQNRRAEHVKNLWQVVDWEMIESRLNI
jgi:Fe-Mn family superoxide dismutase